MAINIETFALIGVYANCLQIFRGNIWDSLSKSFEEPLVMIGDLNMVETVKDRFMNWGKIIAASKKNAWEKCKKHFNLLKIGVIGQVTWQNYGLRMLMKALAWKMLLQPRILLYAFLCGLPCLIWYMHLCTKFSSLDRKRGSKWFHMDTNLFRLPVVQEEVKRIWDHFFNSRATLGKTWTLAIKSTQSCISKGVQKVRD